MWDGRQEYLDCLSAYSALNQGTRPTTIVAATKAQLDRITLTSRAFHNDQMGPFLHELCTLSGFPKALPMNSGAEAVETALKAVRKWGYKVKKVPDGKAEIILCADNFHGRTISIVSFSTEPQYQDGFGPFTPGFKIVKYGDAAALEKAITPNTVAFIVEPIQGEGGVLVPPAGYLKRVREICTRQRVLFVADEIQTGLGRTGKMFCWEWDGAKPDAMIVGKALAGGMYPVSAFLSSEEVMGVFNPGDHGSTFGGNPLVADRPRRAEVLVDEKPADRGAWRLVHGRTAQDRLAEHQGRAGQGPADRRRADRPGAALLRGADGARDPREGNARPRGALRAAAGDLEARPPVGAHRHHRGAPDELRAGGSRALDQGRQE